MLSLTSILAFCAPLPFKDIMLSPISTVVESTLVSVPLIKRSPLIVTLDPVNSKPPSIVSNLLSKPVISPFKLPVLVSKESNLPSCEPLVVSILFNLLFWVVLVLSLEDVYELKVVLILPLSVSKETNLRSWFELVVLLDEV